MLFEEDNIGDGGPRKVLHPTPGKGYDYDLSNSDVLLARMNVKEGRIVLLDDMSYRVLIVQQNRPMTSCAVGVGASGMYDVYLLYRDNIL